MHRDAAHCRSMPISPHGRAVTAMRPNACWLLLSESMREAGGAQAVSAVYAALGDPARRPAAVTALRGVMPRMSAADWVFKVWSMSWYTQLDAVDEAFEVAEQLRTQFAAQRPVNAWSWLWSRELTNFRKDARFQSFASELGLIQYWQKYGPPDDCTLTNGKLACH